MASLKLNKKDSVLQAIKEFDEIGQSAFLDRYGFGKSTSYYLLFEGKIYDSKAIAGVAFGIENPELGYLSRGQFSGGEKTVQRVFEKLGFTVIKKRPVEALVLTQNEVTVREEHNWSDVTGISYNYPNKYRNLIKSGLPFVYYRGVRRKGNKRGTAEYFGSGVIGEIWQDPRQGEDVPKGKREWFCAVENFEPFGVPVPLKVNGNLFEEIENPNRLRDGVREISLEIYERILSQSDEDVNEQKLTPRVKAGDVSPAILNLEEAFLKRPKVNKGKRGEGARPRYSKRSKEIGDWCEELVVMDLKARLTPLEADSIRWLAREGETPGWDIEYISSNGSKKRVEVKGTTAARFSSLEITSNEWEAAKKHRGDYQIALVVNAMIGNEALRYLDDPFEYFNQPSYCVEPSRYRISQFDE